MTEWKVEYCWTDHVRVLASVHVEAKTKTEAEDKVHEALNDGGLYDETPYTLDSMEELQAKILKRKYDDIDDGYPTILEVEESK